MKPITFSSIKNKSGLIRIKMDLDTLNPFQLKTNHDDTFTDITINARLRAARTINLCAKINPRMRTYAIRLDAGCIMSDYKDW
jgi:hypothetical protein